MRRAALLGLCVALAAAGCARLALSRLDRLSPDEPVVGSSGRYAITPEGDAWVRTPDREQGSIDRALARVTADAWLNVSVAEGRYGMAEDALQSARAQVDAMMATRERREEELRIPAPGGSVRALLGVYCGTFDRELRARETCFVLLAAVHGRSAYLLVGQAYQREGRPQELEAMMRSLQLLEEGAPGVPGAEREAAAGAAGGAEEDAPGEAVGALS